MNLKFTKRIFRRNKARSRIRQKHVPAGFIAFFSKPVIGLFYWFLLWLSAFLLATHPQDWTGILFSSGQLSPVTVITAIDFDISQPASDNEALKKKQIPTGTILVRRGQAISAEIMSKLRAYQKKLENFQPLSPEFLAVVGTGLILLLGTLITAVFFHLLAPDLLRRNSMILLFLLISVVTLIAAKGCLLLWYRNIFLPPGSLDYFLPIAFAPILASILIGPRPAIVVGFWVSFAVSVFASFSFSVFALGFLATIVIAQKASVVRTRAKVFRIGLWAGLTGLACALGFSTLSGFIWTTIGIQCVLSLIIGILSALAALLVLPLFEILFGISTDISLLEYADMEHPLLKRLATEAPGTYHHSLMVANLAQAAVSSLGGNALCVAICSYFHDIGKLAKPSFFFENSQFDDNPHDDLSPSMSTLVVTSHVKEGVNLALRYNLPDVVIDAIQQHHGTSLVYLFYQKAASQQSEKTDVLPNGSLQSVREEEFRYPGPKPKSREIAILCLADSIEAASRSLEKISPAHIEHLVQSVIDTKIKDRQLDESDLTLAQIHKIKKAFIFTLTNMLHERTP